MTATTTTPAAEEHEEPYPAQMRAQLGLRPIYYTKFSKKGSHPDQRPRPSWCLIAGSEEYEHDITYADSMEATQSTDGAISIAASQYAAARYTADPDYLGVATLEARLEQLGQGSPIKVALRAEGGPSRRRATARLGGDPAPQPDRR